MYETDDEDTFQRVTFTIEEEEPEPLLKEEGKVMEFPIEYLPETLKNAVINLSKVASCSLSIASNSILSATNLAVQGLADIKMTWGIRPISCYFLTVAESGQRKTTADNIALQGIREFESELIDKYKIERSLFKQQHDTWKTLYNRIIKSKGMTSEEKQREAAELTEPKSPILPYVLCTDPTIEGLHKLLHHGRPYIGLFSSEAGQFLGGYSMGREVKIRSSASLSSLWDGTRIERIRGGDDIIFIEGKKLCIHLMVQPEIMKEFLSDNVFKNQGFLSRMLVVIPSKIKAEDKEYNFDVSTQSLDEFRTKIGSLLRTSKEKAIITMPEDVICFCTNWDKQLQLSAEKEETENIKEFVAKALEHSLRLATTLQLFDDPYCNTLSLDYVFMGTKIVEFYCTQMKQLLRNKTTSKTNLNIPLAEKALVWMRNNWKGEYVTTRDIIQGCYAVHNKYEALQCLKILEDHGWVVKMKGPQTIAGVVKREVWKVVKNNV